MARLHPLVRDTSRSATGTGHRPAFLELAAELLEKAAAADETVLPEEPPTWPAWQLLTPHAAHVLDNLISQSGHPDEAAEAAAYAAYMAARYQAGQGLHAFAEPLLARVLTAQLRVLGPDHLSTLATRHCIALEMAARGDHGGAEAEFRDVLAARLRVLGPDHPDTLATRHSIALQMAERGDHGGAEAEFRDVLAARLRVLGPDHPDTLITSNWLSHLDGQKNT